MNMVSSIVLIGAGGAGKSTISALIGKRLGWSVIEVDTERICYRQEIGYDEAYAEALLQEKGFLAREAYWKQFDIHAVERVIAEFPETHVIAFGAGNSVYDDATYLARAQKALENIPYVIRLLPSPDKDESIRIIKERLRPLIDPERFDAVMEVIMPCVMHPSNDTLATVTFYNGEQTPEETTNAIIQYLQSA